MKLCECGCGMPTAIATRTYTSRGVRRGEPQRYVYGHGRAIIDRVAHFWSQVEKSDGCWNWVGASNAAFGYGLIRWRNGVGKAARPLMRAHRVSWELANGPVPGGLFVCHRCDNPKCVRPDHLFLGTPKENVLDMHAKGRYRRGHGRHLTQDEIEVIRTLSRSLTRAEISRRMGVGLSTVRRYAREVERSCA